MWCPETTMADPSYILFNKSLEQARRLGARGGRAHACNQRARRARMPTPLTTVPLRLAPRETTAQDIAVLDAQFTCVRGADKRVGMGPLLSGGGQSLRVSELACPFGYPAMPSPERPAPPTPGTIGW